MANAVPNALVKLYHFTSIAVPLTLIYYTRYESNLFALHPTLMSLAVCVLLSHGVVMYNEEFDIVRPATRQSKIRSHMIMQLLAIVLMWMGAAAMYKYKKDNWVQHYTTWHSFLGLKVLMATPCVAVGGYLVNRGIYLPYVDHRYIRWGHKLAGLVLYTMCCITVVFGLNSNWATSNIPVVVLVPMMCAMGFKVGVVWYLAKQNGLFAPPRRQHD